MNLSEVATLIVTKSMGSVNFPPERDLTSTKLGDGLIRIYNETLRGVREADKDADGEQRQAAVQLAIATIPTVAKFQIKNPASLEDATENLARAITDVYARMLRSLSLKSP